MLTFNSLILNAPKLLSISSAQDFIRHHYPWSVARADLLSLCQKECEWSDAELVTYTEKLVLHTDAESGYPYLTELIENLEIICAYLFNTAVPELPPMNKECRVSIILVLGTSFSFDTSRFHKFTNAIIRKLAVPQTLSGLLMRGRQEMLDDITLALSADIAIRDFLVAMAHIIGFGVPDFYLHDLGVQLPNLGIITDLIQIISQEYRPFRILEDLTLQVVKALFHFGYRGRLCSKTFQLYRLGEVEDSLIKEDKYYLYFKDELSIYCAFQDKSGNVVRFEVPKGVHVKVFSSLVAVLENPHAELNTTQTKFLLDVVNHYQGSYGYDDAQQQQFIGYLKLVFPELNISRRFLGIYDAQDQQIDLDWNVIKVLVWKYLIQKGYFFHPESWVFDILTPEGDIDREIIIKLFPKCVDLIHFIRCFRGLDLQLIENVAKTYFSIYLEDPDAVELRLSVLLNEISRDESVIFLQLFSWLKIYHMPVLKRVLLAIDPVKKQLLDKSPELIAPLVAIIDDLTLEEQIFIIHQCNYILQQTLERGDYLAQYIIDYIYLLTPHQQALVLQSLNSQLENPLMIAMHDLNNQYALEKMMTLIESFQQSEPSDYVFILLSQKNVAGLNALMLAAKRLPVDSLSLFRLLECVQKLDLEQQYLILKEIDPEGNNVMMLVLNLQSKSCFSLLLKMLIGLGIAKVSDLFKQKNQYQENVLLLAKRADFFKKIICDTGLRIMINEIISMAQLAGRKDLEDTFKQFIESFSTLIQSGHPLALKQKFKQFLRVILRLTSPLANLYFFRTYGTSQDNRVNRDFLSVFEYFDPVFRETVTGYPDCSTLLAEIERDDSEAYLKREHSESDLLRGPR